MISNDSQLAKKLDFSNDTLSRKTTTSKLNLQSKKFHDVMLERDQIHNNMIEIMIENKAIKKRLYEKELECGQL